MSKPNLLQKLAITGVAGAVVATNITTAQAAVIVDHKDYRVTHFFSLNPGGNVIPRVTANFFDHAWVLDPGLRPSVNPPGQPPGFAAGGFELVNRRGQVNNFSRNGANNGQVNTGSFAVPAGGIPFPPGAVRTANVIPPINSAQANSRFGVNPFGAGVPVTGAIQADGFAEARFDTVARTPIPSEAYAFSFASIDVQGGRQFRNGRIRWGPQISTPPVAGGAIAGRFNQRRIRDPIVFNIIDLETGEEIEEVLLDISFDIFGLGSFEWDSTTSTFMIDAENAEFHIDISSPFTTQQGILDLEIANGIITVSNDTGIFDGVLPSVGSPGQFSTTLGEITLDYDFGDFNDNELDITASFSGGGSAQVGISVPEPSSNWSIIIFLGTLAVIKFRTIKNCKTS
ncbi:MAG: hypothetical protein AB4060_20605 [Crocosphaera sp.]